LVKKNKVEKEIAANKAEEPIKVQEDAQMEGDEANIVHQNSSIFDEKPDQIIENQSTKDSEMKEEGNVGGINNLKKSNTKFE
jgi:hypothetical protein